ncbi:GNAT family N-acetyltransferase [Phreatobacter sp.]|uniref:GNAT family N-acetyltransferase n=1 Tax=Phreatobacter sp. TaxID=1966341 RepID=UPI0025E435A1|nr:GNAT family N-acetyltransferase [Phreatobacter sp.]
MTTGTIITRERRTDTAPRDDDEGSLRAIVFDDPAPLEAAWRRLEREGCSTAFQRFDWARSWYASASAAGIAEPMIIAVSRADGGDPVAIFPFARTRSKLGFVIGFADGEVCDHTAPVLASRTVLSDAAAARACDLALAAVTGTDIVKLEKLVPTVGGRPNPLYHLNGAMPFPLASYSVPLDAGWEKRLDKGLVKNLTRARRILREQKGEWSVVRAAPDEAGDVFADLLEQRQARFAATGGTDILDHDHWRAHYAGLLSGPGVVFALRVGDEVVASEFGLTDGDTFLALLPGFRRDGDWKKYSLGQVLTVGIMEWCAAHGLKAYDMTIGSEAYKFAYGVTETRLNAVMRPVSARGHAVTALWRAKERLRDNPQLFTAAKKLFGPLTGRM